VIPQSSPDRALELTSQFAACFRDDRDSDDVEHAVIELARQRVFGLTWGDEDHNDHDRMRDDSLLALLVGKDDLTGKQRV